MYRLCIQAARQINTSVRLPIRQSYRYIPTINHSCRYTSTSTAKETHRTAQNNLYDKKIYNQSNAIDHELFTSTTTSSAKNNFDNYSTAIKNSANNMKNYNGAIISEISKTTSSNTNEHRVEEPEKIIKSKTSSEMPTDIISIILTSIVTIVVGGIALIMLTPFLFVGFIFLAFWVCLSLHLLGVPGMM